MLAKILNKLWPMKEFLNYIFKKTLGDYILNDLDLNKIECEITTNTYISLTNIELNASVINKKHLKDTPLKILSGRINQVLLEYSPDKFEIKLNEVFILLMPVCNEEKFNEEQYQKFKGIEIKSKSNDENSFISNLLNSVLNGLEVSARNICVKILTYEVGLNCRDNPTISVFIGKVDYVKNKLNISGIEQNSPNNSEKLFLTNKQIIVDKFCVKVDRNIKSDENTFFNVCNLNDEKLLFNFFCDNSTILAVKYSEDNNISDSSLLINLLNNPDQVDSFKVDIFMNKFEIFMNPFQLEMIRNFIEVCNLIFNKNNVKENSKKESEGTNNSIKILNFKISSILVNFNLDLFNFILIENCYTYELPKLWSFYEAHYSKSLKTIDNLKSHFSYLEDNFTILYANKLKFRIIDDKINSTTNLELSLDLLNFDYVEYKCKIKLSNEKNNKLKFTASKINSSKFNASIQELSLHNASIYHSVYQSVVSYEQNTSISRGSIYESAIESEFILLEKFNTLFDYEYIHYSHHILETKPSSNSEKSCFVLNFIKKESSYQKVYTHLNFGNLQVEFHPVYLFKALKIIYPNKLLINEILSYNSSSSFNDEDLIKNEINNEPLNFIPEKVNKKTSRQQIYISFNEVNFIIFNFNNNLENSKDSTLNSYFNDFYMSYINNINPNNLFREKIPLSKPDILINTIKSKDYLILKLIKPQLLIDLKIKNDKENTQMFVNFEQLKLILNSDIILNYSKSDKMSSSVLPLENDSIYYSTSQVGLYTQVIDKNNKNNFVTGNYSVQEKLKNEDIDTLINRNEMKFRNHDIGFESYNQEYTSNFDFNTKIKEFYSHFLKIFNHALDDVKIDHENYKNISRKKINIYLKESIQFLIQFKHLQVLKEFLENINFSFNLQKIFLNTLSKTYNELKCKIFDLQNLSLSREYAKKVQYLEDEKNTYNCLVLTLQSKEIFVAFPSSISQEILFKINLNKLNTGFITSGQNNIILINLQDFKCLFKKINEFKYLKESISENDEALYNHLVYVNTVDNNKKPFLNVSVNFKEILNENEKNVEITNKKAETILEYISNNLIPTKDLSLTLDLKVEGLTISPMYKEFNINMFKAFQNEIVDITKDSKLCELLCKSNFYYNLNLNLSNTLIDFYDFNKDDGKLKAKRLFFIIKEINCKKLYSANESFANFSLKNLIINFLVNLNYPDNEKLIDKIWLDAKSLGFVELFNLDKIYFKLSKEGEGLYTEIDVGSIGISFCKDSLNNLILFVESVKSKFTSILALFINTNDISSQIKENQNLLPIQNEQNLKILEDYLQIDFNKEKEPDNSLIKFEDEPISDEKEVNNKLQPRKSLCKYFEEKEFKPSLNNGEVLLKVKFESLRVYFYNGKDFDFVVGNQFKFINTGSIRKSDSNDTYNFELIEDFYSQTISVNDLIIEKDVLRKKRGEKDFKNYININLENLIFEGIFYQINDETEDRIFDIKFCLSKFEIEDFVKDSKYKKIISKYNYDNNEDFIHIKAQMFKVNSQISNNNIVEAENNNNLNVTGSSFNAQGKDSELHLDIKIQPINLLLDQSTLIFIFDYFSQDNTITTRNSISVNRDNNSLLSEEKQVNLVFVRRIKINEFFLNISYNSHTLSLTRIKNKDFLELMNLSNITDLRINLKQFDHTGCKTVSEIGDLILEKWKEDIIQNQMYSAVFNSVSVIKPFTTMFNGFVDLFKQPWLYFKNDKSVKDGFSKGFKNFFISFSSQSLFLGEKMFMTFKNYLGGSNKAEKTLNKNSLYKKYLYYFNDQKKRYDEYYLKK